jgi:ubiquitin carboxyl-terminal hydrolase 10
MTPVAGESSGPAQYKLFGVLYHHGEPTGNGHYTVDVFHPNGAGGSGEGWLHIDDETVNAVQHEDVFGEHGIGRVDNRCAYMLFYCLIVSAARI